MKRIDNLRKLINANESLLISDPINIRYLCGFTGSFGYLLVNPDESILFTDSRYEIQSRAETKYVSLKFGRDVFDFIENNCASEKLLVEGNHMTVSVFNRMRSAVTFTVSAHEPIVEKLRVIKDADELEKIERACAISIAALEELTKTNPRNLTERQYALQLERLMIDHGAEAIAFETIVASGANSAIPHHQPTNRVIAEGDLLKIDFGAQFSGYKSDCTRTFVVGRANEFQKNIYEAVRNAQHIGRSKVKAGSKCSEIDEAVRKVLRSHDFGATFQHGLGHGVGLAIHEDPFFGRENVTRLANGTVLTIEPGLYVEAQGGVRIEDTIVVTDDGYRNLTDFPYELISL